MSVTCETSTAELAAERHEARQIVNEVINHGVSERQKLAVIKFMSEHIDDFELSKLLCWFIDEVELRSGDAAKLIELRDAALLRMDLIMGHER